MRYDANDDQALLNMLTWHYQKVITVANTWGCYKVSMFLHVVGHNHRFRVIHNMFRRSMETISRYFKQVLYAIGELRGEMIVSPSGQTPTKIRTSPRWYPYFKVSTDSM